MKIYLASSWRNQQQTAVVEALRSDGHEVYDFKNPTPEDQGFAWNHIHGNPPPWTAEKTLEVLNHPIADHGFGLDFNAMKWSDAIVMLQPCGRSAALELGWGAGAGKLTIVVLADDQEPELMLKAADYVVTSVEKAREILSSIAVTECMTESHGTL